MTLQALGIAAAGGQALLRRIDEVSAALAKAAAAPSRTDALDLTVDGDGFLRVILPDGDVAFTRAFHLTRNADGYLTTAEGLLIDPPVQVPPFVGSVTVDPDGVVQGHPAEEPEASVAIGEIELSRFENPSALESEDGVLFRATAAAGERADGRPGEGLGAIRPRPALDPMKELMNLVALQRAFELNNQVIRAADEVLQGINTLRRKP
jgi:flagellar basal-body rod protein FlgG